MGPAKFLYDADNRLVWTSGYRYVYDGNGGRVEKCAVGTPTTACPTSGTTGTLYWHDLGGETLVESDLGGNSQEQYIYFNGLRMARRDVTSTGATVAVHYYISDHLGTHSIVTDQNGTMPPQLESDFYPYGGEIPITTGDPNHYKFTGKERDAESGLDNFGARFDASNLGRFVTVDPLLGSLGDPQSLNRYAYVRNNPSTLNDPSGLSPDYNELYSGIPRAGEWCQGVRTAVSEFESGYQGYSSLMADLFVANYDAAQTRDNDTTAQNKYDPNKTGPEDPTSPGNPLFQNKDVKKESDKLFMSTTNGDARSGLAESGVAIEYKDGKISFGKQVSSVHGDGKPNELQIPTDNNTIAVLHTHGNKALPTPSMPTKDSPGDVGSKFPNFVRSRSALYVTVPGTTTYIQLVPAPSN